MTFPAGAWVTALAAVTVLSGCGWNYGMAAGAGPGVCSTLTVVASDSRSLTDERIETVGDLRSALRDVQRGLASAQQSSDGLARAVLGNLRDAATSAIGIISDRDDATPIEDLPSTFGRTGRRLQDHIQEVREKIGCA